MAPAPRLFILAVVLTASACTQRPKVLASSDQAPTSRFSVAVPPGREADDLGRFLAGMPGKPGSAFKDLEQRGEWQYHSRASDLAWARFEKERLPALQEFAAKELGGTRAASDTVFYPFGGPDALTVVTFFPRHARWVLVALEPPGTVSKPEKFKSLELGTRLAAVRQTLDSLLKRSFFVTRQMDFQLRGQVADGVLVDLLVELVRRGYTIRGSKYLEISEDGWLAERRDDPRLQLKNRGLVLDVEEPSGELHQLYFLSVNLANDKLAPNPRFEKLAFTGPKTVTFLKSTSYLLHHENFTLIRDRILEHSAAILQDDSGVQYKFLAGGNWQPRLYGAYNEPFYPFAWRRQKDLREAFAAPGTARPLGFRIGYGYGRIPSNLTLAQIPADLSMKR